MSTPDPEEIPIDQLIEASSFGTPEARAARATVSDEHAAWLVARSTAHPEETERVEFYGLSIAKDRLTMAEHALKVHSGTEETERDALAKLLDHEPDWTTARNGQPMSCSCGGQIPEPTWEAVWLHRADAILAARRLSESEIRRETVEQVATWLEGFDLGGSWDWADATASDVPAFIREHWGKELTDD